LAELMHYGTPRHSGRYPYGSGDNPYQRSNTLRKQVNALYAEGLTESQIAKGLGFKSSSELRANLSLEKAAIKQADIYEAIRLKEKGLSNVAIGERLGIPESTVRNYLKPSALANAVVIDSTAEMLKKEIDAKLYLDVGAGVENQMGITSTRLKNAVALLKEEGYTLHYTNVEQLGTGKKTTIKVLTKNDISDQEVYANKDKIRTVTDWSEDGGRTWQTVKDPVSLDSARIMVRFGDSTPSGSDMDGTIQLRRGVADISLGDSRYAQVRIAVDGTHYMKGMAIYSDDMPDGVDVIYNSNKPSSVGKLGAMKAMNQRIDLEDGGSIYIDKNGTQKLNDFGASIRQKTYIDSDGNEKLSPINIVGFQGKEGSGSEGSWDSWSKTLSSQFLSKQSVPLAKKQLGLSLDIQKSEFDEIMSLTNPAVRVRLLDSFADDCDSKAVNLKAAALPRQSSKVIIPITSLKEDQCYTTAYKDGEKLALIRYPHAGPFEIPVVTVNNKNKEGKSVLGNASDAIGITPKTASILSGADFDGDTVIVIPFTKDIKVTGPLAGLENFDPKTAYPAYEGMKPISPKTKQTEMGKVSNLITDMSIKGADDDEIAAAVRHSMVVIDSEKHNLNYKQSYIDNGIASLKVTYQGGTLTQPKGASTLISRASSEIRVPERRAVKKSDIEADPSLANVVRKSGYSVDPETGKKIYITKEGYTKADGTTGYKKVKSTKMFETDDAFTLSGGSDMENAYASYANSMKSLGDQARKASANTPSTLYSPTAKKIYANEVASLKAKYSIAASNKPLERQAQLLANAVVDSKKESNPDLTASELKKIKAQALQEARTRVGANKQSIDISDKEWEAIQSGAISQNFLTQILNNTDIDRIKQLATPRESSTGLSAAKEAKARALYNNGLGLAAIADSLGVSTSTISKLLKAS